MKRSPFWVACLGITMALTSLASTTGAATSVSVNIRIGDPYRGPRLVFAHEPDIVVVPQSRVYYVRNCDYDLYRYGSYWYYQFEGGWYRSRAHRGPFVYINYRSVPRAVYTVPVKYRRHWRDFPGRGHAYGHERRERREVAREDFREERRDRGR